MSTLCQIGELLCATSAQYYKSILLAKTLSDKDKPSEALSLMKSSATKLASDLVLVLTIIRVSDAIIPERLSKRITLSIEAIQREIKNAAESNTLPAYYDVLSLHLAKGAEPNILESLAVECEALVPSCEHCEICVRCPRCGGQGNGICKLEPSQYATCLNSPKT